VTSLTPLSDIVSSVLFAAVEKPESVSYTEYFATSSCVGEAVEVSLQSQGAKLLSDHGSDGPSTDRKTLCSLFMNNNLEDVSVWGMEINRPNILVSNARVSNGVSE
jgi:hypothetical protein